MQLQELVSADKARFKAGAGQKDLYAARIFVA
jgi:hypothetical protein